MDKKKVVILFGGQSSEHVVSCMSAQNVINSVDKALFDPLLIGITAEGRWIYVEDPGKIADGSWQNGPVRAVLSPDAMDCGVWLLNGNQAEKISVDVVFPVLHGLNGEDGTIQGLLELSKIPYVGCGVLSSAVSMDKYYTKIIVNSLGIRQADYLIVFAADMEREQQVVAAAERKFTYPVFVKPANAGSSQGVSKAENAVQLIAGLRAALKHDKKVLIEEMIAGREIECAVFGGGKVPVEVSGVGEILAAADFYDFEAKYYNTDSKTVVEPELSGDIADRIRTAAQRIFQAVEGYGLARADFFVTADSTVVFNEINTMPGFTAISMYPMLWEAKGISKKTLVTKLLDHALRRYE